MSKKKKEIALKNEENDDEEIIKLKKLSIVIDSRKKSKKKYLILLIEEFIDILIFQIIIEMLQIIVIKITMTKLIEHLQREIRPLKNKKKKIYI